MAVTSSMAFYKIIYISKDPLTFDACTQFTLSCDKSSSQFTMVNSWQMLEISRRIIGILSKVHVITVGFMVHVCVLSFSST